MEIAFIKITRVTLLFFFLQKECMGKCSVKSTMSGKLADEENDPYCHHHHHHHRPSLPPEVVS